MAGIEELDVRTMTVSTTESPDGRNEVLLGVTYCKAVDRNQLRTFYENFTLSTWGALRLADHYEVHASEMSRRFGPPLDFYFDLARELRKVAAMNTILMQEPSRSDPVDPRGS